MAPDESRVRLRSDEYLPGCVAALRATYESDAYPSRWPDDPAGWLAPSGLLHAWVALDGDVIAGHVALRSVPAPAEASLLEATGRTEATLASVSRLFVAPGARGRGLAGALLDAATSRARADGLRCVLDVVADGRSAIALYESHGWVRVGTLPATWVDRFGEHPLVHLYVAPALP